MWIKIFNITIHVIYPFMLMNFFIEINFLLNQIIIKDDTHKINCIKKNDMNNYTY